MNTNRQITHPLIGASLFLFVILLFVSCGKEEYCSPLQSITIEDVTLGYMEDSCYISIEGGKLGDFIITYSDQWCSVSVSGPSLMVKVKENLSINDRSTKVTLTDSNDGSTLSFMVFQRLNCTLLDKITSFELISNNNNYKSFLITDDAIHIVVPQTEGLSSMKIQLNHTGNQIVFDGDKNWEKNKYDFSDFINPHVLSLTTKDGVVKKWSVVVYDLPVLIINTPDSMPIVSKTERKEGCKLTLVTVDGLVDSLGTAGIKGRGNSTWEEPKKPYNIKFDKKQAPLGMMSSKHWVLLSNPYYDRTQLHNDVAFEIARHTDFPWVQSGRYVELIMNGKHLGLYYLCEKVRIEKGKIDIAQITPTDTVGESLTGGYMLETSTSPKDNHFISDFYYKTGEGYSWIFYWNISTPEGNIPQSQFNYIQNSINKLESIIDCDSTLTNGLYRNLLDIESVINWWLVENVCLNEEASRTKNMIIYKDIDSSVGGGKITIGPPWDFDAWTFGTCGIKVLYVNETTWCFKRLLRDPYFIKRLKEKWNAYYLEWNNYIPEYIDKQYKLIHRSALRNEKMWPRWFHSDDTYENKINNMKESFRIQLNWMYDKIDAL